MATELGPHRYKLDPAVRVVANGNPVVNTVRSERAAFVAVKDSELLEAVEVQREPEDLPPKRLPARKHRGSLDEIAPDVEVNVFVQLVEGTQDLPPLLENVAYRPDPSLSVATATVPLAALPEILDHPAVVGVQAGERVVFSPPEVRDADREPDRDRSRIAADVGRRGDGVLIGIVDVGGFDFGHPDFLDADGRTRFERIWDQGGGLRDAPEPYGYGAEFRREHLDAALEAAPTVGLPATELERQSQRSLASHATHVASIAAGNHGVCPGATLAGVLIDLPREDTDRRKSFYDSTRIAHAVDYLFRLGDDLGLPVSINVSLGTNGHAHDASSAVSRWIDHATARPGRCVTVAAGNAGQEAAAGPGDWGFVTGRIHTSGRVPAAGLTRELEWIVIGDGIADLSENELVLWYAPQDRLAVQVRPPGGDWTKPVEAGEFIENLLLPSKTVLSVYHDRYHPANGHNTVSIYLSPFMTEHAVAGVAAGTWTVRLVGKEIRDGRYDGWIERDDPRRLGPMGTVDAWAFPSFFSNGTNVDDSSISSLACGQRVVAVANLDARAGRINVTSSQGPTRDEREKPEVAAPGTGVVAASGFDPDREWVAMTGTSMAAPYVAGVVGLMLDQDEPLTAAQIGGILRRTAQPLPGADFSWLNDAGYGQVNPRGAVAEAEQVNARSDLKR